MSDEENNYQTVVNYCVSCGSIIYNGDHICDECKKKLYN